MRIGSLRHRISLLEHAVAVDEYGAPIPVTSDSWTEFATVWGSIDPIYGREFWEAQQVQNEVHVRIRIRYRKDVKPDMRVKHKEDVYSIISVLQSNDMRETQLMCKLLSSEQDEEE